MVGVALPNTFCPSPIAVGSPSAQPNVGLWQVLQLIQFDPDSLGSKNSIFPNLILYEFDLLRIGRSISGITNSLLKISMSFLSEAFANDAVKLSVKINILRAYHLIFITGPYTLIKLEDEASILGGVYR